VERVSKYTVLGRLLDGRARTFNVGTVRAFGRHPGLPRRTLTADNGKEFAAFKVLERRLGLDVYFARPYHAWERGLNENTNGLLRQFFPKGLDLRGATHPYVKSVEHLLNTRPRKSLGYRTPHRVWASPPGRSGLPLLSPADGADRGNNDLLLPAQGPAMNWVAEKSGSLSYFPLDILAKLDKLLDLKLSDQIRPRGNMRE
jgi:transposase InsO family protein